MPDDPPPARTFSFDGVPISALPGQSVGAALLAAGYRSVRDTRFQNRQRGLFCGIGFCFDCLVTVDGRPNLRACVTSAEPGAVVTRQDGPGRYDDVPVPDVLVPDVPVPDVPVPDVPVPDVLVVGGGPAGLAATAAAAGAGCRVRLIDASGQLGGQYYRQLPAAMRAAAPDRMPADDAAGERLRRSVNAPGITVSICTQVFAARLEGGRPELHLTGPGGATSVARAATVVLAPGAYDRSLPFPGWDLPGVLTAGGAQALLKGQGVLAGRRVVVGGTGPFLLPVAAGLAQAGATVLGVHEASSPAAWRRHLGTVAGNPAKLAEASHYLRILRRYRVPVRFRSAVTRVSGTDAVTSATVSRLDAGWNRRPGRDEVVECDAVCVGWGFTPNIELALALGVRTRTSTDGSVVAGADSFGRTSVPGVLAAGEVAGVAGSAAAVAEGQLAGLAAAEYVGRLSLADLHRRFRRLVARRDRLRRFGAALLDVYPVRPGWIGWLDDDTVVCRCEEVPLAAVRRAVTELGATDLRSLKLFTRVGMGMCQGRVCGHPAAALLHQATGHPPGDCEAFGNRPIATPVSLQALAQHGE